MIRGRRVLGFLWAATFAVDANARPPKPGRDAFLDPPSSGTFVNVAAFTLGAMAQLENRTHLEPGYSMLTTQVSALGALGFGEISASAEARLLFVSLGVTGGVRDAWRQYVGGPGGLTREDRRVAEKSGGIYSDVFPFAEARARISVPLETFFWTHAFTGRFEDSAARGYDWVHTNVHDGGAIFKYESTLFVRSPTFGAIGPAVRYMNLPREGARVGEWAVGANFVSRVFPKRADTAIVQFLIRPGDDEFGFSTMRSPVYLMLIYRLVIPLHTGTFD